MDDVFDYVVIGGGSAGSIVAGRLAQASVRVLVLEAGMSDRKATVRIPAAVRSVYGKANWTYLTAPDASRGGVEDARRVGRILGGGGSINSMVFIRGHRADFDGWSKSGAIGWDYDSVLSSFKRLETWEYGENEYRGGRGPIAVAVQGNRRPGCMAWIEAARQAGYPKNPDYNGGDGLEGVGLSQVNQRRGLHSQSSHEYLHRLAPADFLTVRTGAIASRIVIKGGRAVGVEYRHGGLTKLVRVRDEVILSAGAFGSPKLLMLSGIGPRDELSRVGIDVAVHRPGVGQNLHDHVMVMQPYRSKIPTINRRRLVDFTKGFTDLVLHGRGILTTSVVQAIAMHRTQSTLPAPDTQLMFADFAITREIRPDGTVRVAPAKEEGFNAASTYVTTQGRGRLRLRNSLPDAPPIIEHDLLAEPEDLRGVLAGMEEARRVMEQQAIAELVDGPFEQTANCRTNSDWEQYARTHAAAPSHPVGTCRVGTDEQAVVDPELRVFGVLGLRVVDSSIMPSVTRGNTNAPTMMIGERAMDFIVGGPFTRADGS